MVSAPFAEFTWRHARKLAVEADLDDANESVIAQILDDLLTRAEHGPDTAAARVVGRTRTAAALRPPLPVTAAHEHIPAQLEADDATEQSPPLTAADQPPDIAPMPIFDPFAEAEHGW